MFIKCLLTTATALAVGIAQADVVRLGVTNDRSGVYADLAGLGSEVAVRMAVEDVGGQVAGKTVEVIGGDNQNKADIASAMVRRWFDTQNLVAVLDGGSSSTGLAALGIVREKGGTALISGSFSSAFSGKQCSHLGTQWAPDTYALANAAVSGAVQPGQAWYTIVPDYAFGISMETVAHRFAQAAGARVLGGTRHPLGGMDFASFLLQAQSSKADVIAIASAGGDLVNLMKQAQEFGLSGGKQRLLTLLAFISDIHAMGLEAAQDLIFPTVFYWDANEETRAWTRRWQEKMGVTRPPTIIQVLSYVATRHYLEAAEAVGSFKGAAVNQKMRELPIQSTLIQNARVRPEDGRVIMDMFLMQVKTPSESRYDGDYYRVLSTVPGDQVFVSLADSECPLVNP